MTFEQMQSCWRNQEKQLLDARYLNVKMMNFESLQKVKNIMLEVLIARIIEGFLFAAIVFFLGGYIAQNWAFSAPVISAVILDLFAIFGLAGNIAQIVLIKQIDYSKPVKKVQHQLYRLRSHSLVITKLVLLSVPFYMAYVFLGYDIVWDIDLYSYLDDSTRNFYWISSIVALVPVGWLFIQLHESNLKVKWIKLLAEEIAGKKLLAIVNILDEYREAEIENNN